MAAVGLVLNLAIAKALGGHGHDINIRAAWIHMVGDAASCVGIIVGAWVIRQTGWLAIDPLLSILIAVMIVWTAWDIFRDSLNILLRAHHARIIQVRLQLRHKHGGRFSDRFLGRQGASKHQNEQGRDCGNSI